MIRKALRNIFKKRKTCKYPFAKPKVAKGFRGKQIYDRKKCTGCKRCVIHCPTNTIKFLSKTKKVKINLDKCIFCGVCEDVCPVRAILFSKEFSMASHDKKKLYVN